MGAVKGGSGAGTCLGQGHGFTQEGGKMGTILSEPDGLEDFYWEKPCSSEGDKERVRGNWQSRAGCPSQCCSPWGSQGSQWVPGCCFGISQCSLCAAVISKLFFMFQEAMYFQFDFISTLIFKFRYLYFVKTVSASLSTGTMPLIPQLLTVKHSFSYTALKNTINEACETASTAGVKHFHVLAESGNQVVRSFRTDWRSIRNCLDLTKPSYFS